MENPIGLLIEIILAAALFYAAGRGIWWVVRMAWRRVEQNRQTMEYQRQKQARELLAAIDEAVQHAPVSADQKLVIRTQSADVPRNLARSTDKLRRLRKLQELSQQHTGVHDPELDAMEQKLVAAMDRSLDVLLSIPKSLMKVETARDEKAVECIIAELSETNASMLDIADVRADIAKTRNS